MELTIVHLCPPVHIIDAQSCCWRRCLAVNCIQSERMHFNCNNNSIRNCPHVALHRLLLGFIVASLAEFHGATWSLMLDSPLPALFAFVANFDPQLSTDYFQQHASFCIFSFGLIQHAVRKSKLTLQSLFVLYHMKLIAQAYIWRTHVQGMGS